MSTTVPSYEIESVELKGREIVDMGNSHPMRRSGIVHIAISISIEEAQEFIAKDWRVFGDSDGPYLVLRVPSGMTPTYWSRNSVDVKFKPVPWRLWDTHSGVICWLERIV